jgi:hypothetical protein
MDRATCDDGRKPSSAHLTGTSRQIPRRPERNTHNNQCQIVEAVAMDEIFPAGETNGEILIGRCRELLGDDALDLPDDEIDRIRRCADTVAHAVIAMFLDEQRSTIH